MLAETQRTCSTSWERKRQKCEGWSYKVRADYARHESAFDAEPQFENTSEKPPNSCTARLQNRGKMGHGRDLVRKDVETCATN